MSPQIEQTRPAAVAGSFYPAQREELLQTVRQLLNEAAKKKALPVYPKAKAIVAPHAGYIYSGPIAASVYAPLREIAANIKKIVLLGPAHRTSFHGLALPSAAYFETPLGKITLDSEGMKTARRFPQVQILDEAHREEHSLEVHLPFLQEIFGNFSLIPLAVGETPAEEVAEVLAALWGGEETLIVISSDLSHYHDYQTAKKIDAQTSNAILALRPEAIDYEQACGRDPLNGLLYLAKQRALTPYLVDLRNSGDTAGTHHRVVGYGAYVFAA